MERGKGRGKRVGEGEKGKEEKWKRGGEEGSEREGRGREGRGGSVPLQVLPVPPTF